MPHRRWRGLGCPTERPRGLQEEQARVSVGPLGSSRHIPPSAGASAQVPEPEPLGQGHPRHGEPPPCAHRDRPKPLSPGLKTLATLGPHHPPSSPVWRAPGTALTPHGPCQAWPCDSELGPSHSGTALLVAPFMVASGIVLQGAPFLRIPLFQVSALYCVMGGGWLPFPPLAAPGPLRAALQEG